MQALVHLAENLRPRSVTRRSGVPPRFKNEDGHMVNAKASREEIRFANRP
jgi:hypothetical protein